ncbi:MAG: 2-hydroxyacyl-CoA dehydratase family protein, partial [Candidatus Binatia bacterium]
MWTSAGRSCRAASSSCAANTQRLEERLGIASITLAGDLNDLRCYSDEQARTQIEAFVEQL